MSKMDAVRKALEEDPDITGKEGSEFVKKRFGLDVPANIFSQYRSTILKKQGGTAATQPVRTRADYTGPKPVDREAIRTANELYKRFGEDMLETILDALKKYGEDGLREAFEIVKMFHEEEDAVTSK
jgi:hypothetical protein